MTDLPTPAQTFAERVGDATTAALLAIGDAIREDDDDTETTLSVEEVSRSILNALAAAGLTVAQVAPERPGWDHPLERQTKTLRRWLRGESVNDADLAAELHAWANHFDDLRGVPRRRSDPSDLYTTKTWGVIAAVVIRQAARDREAGATLAASSASAVAEMVRLSPHLAGTLAVLDPPADNPPSDDDPPCDDGYTTRPTVIRLYHEMTCGTDEDGLDWSVDGGAIRPDGEWLVTEWVDGFATFAEAWTCANDEAALRHIPIVQLATGVQR